MEWSSGILDDAVAFYISVASFCISVASFFVGYFIIPLRDKRMKAEDDFIVLFRGLIEDYPQYQTLSSLNGKPLTDANKLKEKIKANCELMKISIRRRGRTNEQSKALTESIDSFLDSFTDDNFNQVISACKSYTNQF